MKRIIITIMFIMIAEITFGENPTNKHISAFEAKTMLLGEWKLIPEQNAFYYDLLNSVEIDPGYIFKENNIFEKISHTEDITKGQWDVIEYNYEPYLIVQFYNVVTLLYKIVFSDNTLSLEFVKIGENNIKPDIQVLEKIHILE